MKKLFKKPIFIVALIIIVIIAVIFFSRGSKKLPYEVVVAKKGGVIQEVSVTGQVKSEKNINLAFEKAGRIASINVSVGDKVLAGQILMRLANADVVAQLAQAEADVKVQQANLDELKAGTRPEEIQVQEVKVVNAKVALENAKKDLVDKIQDAYTKSDDAIRNKVDQFFENPRQANTQLTFTVDAQLLKSELEQNRRLLETTLINWKSSLDQLTVSSDLDSYSDAADKNLVQVRTVLDEAALAVNSVKATPILTQTTINGWKSDVSTGRTNVYTATTNLSSAEDELKTAQSDLALAEQELILDKAGSTAEQIAAHEAEVEQAKANVDNYQAQLTKTILRSPINGIVTEQDGNVGEIIAANTTLVSLISENNFKIEANIPETDIAKVKVGDTANITLDAYGSGVIFEATVTAIDPAETVIEGVATYKTTFHFTKEDERIKSGMTANIDILTDKRENVIVLPQRAIISKNGDKMVRILTGADTLEIKIKTGLRGSDGNIEITEGVEEGDKVIISVK